MRWIIISKLTLRLLPPADNPAAAEEVAAAADPVAVADVEGDMVDSKSRSAVRSVLHQSIWYTVCYSLNWVGGRLFPDRDVAPLMLIKLGNKQIDK